MLMQFPHTQAHIFDTLDFDMMRFCVLGCLTPNFVWILADRLDLVLVVWFLVM